MKSISQMVMGLIYLLAVGLPAYQIIRHSQTEIQYLEKAYDINNLQNNGAIKEAELWKQIKKQHHFFGGWIDHFFQPTIDKQFKIPTLKKAQEDLDKIPGLNQLQQNEASTARLWALVLAGVSLVYFAVVFAGRNEKQSGLIFALTLISVVFLVVGVIAPAMVVAVSPAMPVFPRFILHYEVRSVLGVILELYASSYWLVAVCLTVFSMLVPLTKAFLTVFTLEWASLSAKPKIARWLHDISKWSMADVFVAAIILSNFAIKSNPSLQGHLFLGFYFFLTYCLLSMVITTMLENKVQREGSALNRPRLKILELLNHLLRRTKRPL
jgi:paraquat-inducible protein A